jgi:CO dehydrogenase maturation factor
LKIAITGKGGTGKTTIAALLARHIAAHGREVIAVDADPDANLASALGIPPDKAPVPIGRMKDFIKERTGATGGYGAYFRINPRVDDIPDKYCAQVDGIKLLTLGGVERGGGGCICPEGALLKALMTHLILERREVVILDMEAGIEHLGRATAQAVSVMVIVVEPGARSLQTARTIKRLAGEIGVPHVVAVINKAMPGQPLGPIEEALDGLPVLAVFPYDADILNADVEDRSPYTGSPAQVAVLDGFVAALERLEAGG